MAKQAAPNLLAAWMAPFAPFFTRPTWANLLVPVAGALLAPGRRTVTTALDSMGLREARPDVTFSDALAVVRRQLWIAELSSTSANHADVAKIPRALLERLTYAACHPA